MNGNFKELDISARKQVKNFPVKSARCCAVTFDNKFLVTADYGNGENCNITKWSVRTKKELHT